jgi:hypothetical protein
VNDERGHRHVRLALSLPNVNQHPEEGHDELAHMADETSLINIINGLVSIVSRRTTIYTKVSASVTPSQGVKEFGVTACSTARCTARRAASA